MNQHPVSLEVVQRVLYRRALQRAIDLEVNFTTLFRVLNNIILYNYRFGTSYIYTVETTTSDFFDEVFEVGEQLFETLTGGIRTGHQVVFESIATVGTDSFLIYINNYPAVHQYLAWSENIFIFNVYTVRSRGHSCYTDTVYIAITDLFNLTSELIKVSTIRRQ